MSKSHLIAGVALIGVMASSIPAQAAPPAQSSSAKEEARAALMQICLLNRPQNFCADMVALKMDHWQLALDQCAGNCKSLKDAYWQKLADAFNSRL